MAENYYFKNKTGSIVAVWKIDETEDELYQMLLFNDDMKSKLNGFRNQSRKMEWIASRVLLYNHTGFIPQVEYNEIGQPFISGLNKSISISHTTGYAAITISEFGIAGIDIELPKERILRVAERFVNPKEASFVPKEEELNYLTLIWCAKETLFKMTPKNDINFKEDMILFPFKIDNEGIIKAKVFEKCTSEYDLFYKITPDYHLVWSC